MDSYSKRPLHQSLLLVLLFLLSNLFTFYLAAPWHFNVHTRDADRSVGAGALLNSLHAELDATRAELQRTQRGLEGLRQELEAKCTRLQGGPNGKQGGDPTGRAGEPSYEWEGTELREYVAVRRLPLGWSAGLAADTVVSPIGHSCAREAKELQRYMEYEVGGLCPDDQGAAHLLTVHGCEPLPRRRCLARSPVNFTEPPPFPECLWSTPPDDNILWTPYSCKSFACLNQRKQKKIFEDCVDCFDLRGREQQRWTKRAGELDFSIVDVLGLKPVGSIRIGLDIGGGPGTFAVRMLEKNVTIVTTTLNLNGPFNSFIAHRGVVPLFLTIAQRLPFFDNTLDIVHSMHVLSHWLPTETLEFLLFDIDRVLRPGGLLWIDHFFCIKPQLDEVYVPLLEKLGYRKLKWGVGPKLDRGHELQEVYLSAVLEKPIARLA